MSDLSGIVIQERYQFEVCLGEGTFAKVYRVHDDHRNVDLAAKVLREDIAHDETWLARFRAESDVLSRLQHPHIVRFYDFIETDEIAFILMDYIPGETLRSTLHHLERPLGINEVFTYLKPLTSGLHYAHGEGIVHRDLKPGNILLHQNGSLLISDFGIAYAGTETEHEQTSIRGVLGTPLYMAPEQIYNLEVSTATDVYALGVLLYQMLTGMPPFNGLHPSAEGETRSEKIAYEHLYVAPPPMQSRLNQASLAIEEVVIRCLAKEPAHRPRGVREVYDAIAEAIGAAPSELTPLPETNVALPPVAKTLPEFSQFLRFSTKEASQPQPAAMSSQIVAPIEEETAENIYPRNVLEGRERPTIQNSRPVYIRQTLPPDEVSISKPTPPGIVIPPQPTSATQHQFKQSGTTHNFNYSLLLLSGVLLVILSCGGLAAYMVGAFSFSTQNKQPTSIADEIPTVTIEITSSIEESIGASALVPSPTEISDVPTASATTDTYTDGLIVYASDRYDSFDIFITDPAAETIRQRITDDVSLNESGPAWSPNATLIAYYVYSGSDIEGDADIYVMNADGTNQRNLTDSPDENDRYVTWSPDGQQLAFHSNRRSDGSNDDTRDFEIYIYDFSTGNIEQLTQNETNDLGPDWSPDGRYLAYHSVDPQTSRSRITVYDFNTGEQAFITPPLLEARFPTWSPDGTQLAFHVAEPTSGRSQIYLVNANGENLRPLLEVYVNDAFPDWSPDGSEIVFHRQTEDGFFGIFRFNFETNNVVPVGQQLRDFFPDWASSLDS